MDSPPVHRKVQAFARRLLDKANGDPVRASELPVPVLEDAELEPGGHVHRLLAEVRKVLMPETVIGLGRPIQHLAGDASWEGGRHGLRCGKLLMKQGREEGPAIPRGMSMSRAHK